MISISSDRLSQYLVSRYPSATISDFKFLVSGFESDIYTFSLRLPSESAQNFILRLYPGEGAAEKLTREARGLHLLGQLGYPVPALLLQETDTGILGKPFEIIERLEGHALWPLLASVDAPQAIQLLDRFGILLSQLHKLDWHLFTENADSYDRNPTLLLDEMLSHYHALYTKYAVKGFFPVIDWLDLHKREVSVRPAVVHQDFHANNVFLCSNNQLSVMDWTQIAVSDYRIDLCWTLLIMGDFGRADWARQILDAYTAASDVPIDHLDYFNVLVYMKLLASTVISVHFSPQELGMRPETIESWKGQISIYRQLSHKMKSITGVLVPELETMLMGCAAPEPGC